MPKRATSSFVASAGLWSVLAFSLNLAWEIAHVRLYTLWAEADVLGVAWALFHCTLGDVLIALGAFLLASIVLGRIDWPVSRHRAGGILVVASTMGYTSWSEWYNVYRAGSWRYTELMPTVFDIGLSPLLQWLILPIVMVIAYRRICKKILSSTQCIDRSGYDRCAENAMTRRCKITIRTSLFRNQG